MDANQTSPASHASTATQKPGRPSHSNRRTNPLRRNRIIDATPPAAVAWKLIRRISS
jgi:hypothetical protein